MNPRLRERFGKEENGDTSVLAKIVQPGIAILRNCGTMEFVSYTFQAPAIRLVLSAASDGEALGPLFPNFVVVRPGGFCPGQRWGF